MYWKQNCLPAFAKNTKISINFGYFSSSKIIIRWIRNGRSYLSPWYSSMTDVESNSLKSGIESPSKLNCPNTLAFVAAFMFVFTQNGRRWKVMRAKRIISSETYRINEMAAPRWRDNVNFMADLLQAILTRILMHSKSVCLKHAKCRQLLQD